MSTGKLQLERITDGLTIRRVGRQIEVHEMVDSTNEVAWARVAGVYPPPPLAAQGMGHPAHPAKTFPSPPLAAQGMGHPHPGRVAVGEAARAEARGSLAEGSAGDGLVIFAEYQSAGRGRLGCSWDSPRGASVLMSLVLVDPEGELGGDALALLAAVAAVDAIDTATTMTPEIKWPNDLMVNGRKLGGILVECHRAPSPTLSRAGARQQDGAPGGILVECHRAPSPTLSRAGARQQDGAPRARQQDGAPRARQQDGAPRARQQDGAPADETLLPSSAGVSPAATPARVYVVGIGINCLQHRSHFPPELRASATSLELESPQPIDRTAVARHLLLELDHWLAEPQRWDTRVLRNEWVRRALPLGRRIRLRQAGEEFSGCVVDVDPAAGLVVQLDQGGRRLFDAASTSVLE